MVAKESCGSYVQLVKLKGVLFSWVDIPLIVSKSVQEPNLFIFSIDFSILTGTWYQNSN